MSYCLSAEHVATAFASGSLRVDDELLQFESVELGVLEITSGYIGASDPLVDPCPDGFTLKVPAGTHPVRVAIAKLPNGDERIAFARIDFDRSATVYRWEMAVIQDQDVAQLKQDEFFGYGVDAGTGCFMDAETGLLLEARMDQDDEYFEEIIESMDKTYKHTRSWANFRPSSDSTLNVICFSSGWGDGSYPSFFGFGADGEIAALVTDFLVTDNSDD
jgi:hypothetical protein